MLTWNSVAFYIQTMASQWRELRPKYRSQTAEKGCNNYQKWPRYLKYTHYKTLSQLHCSWITVNEKVIVFNFRRHSYSTFSKTAQ
jgi:hypothetical protein